jgi:hypothetical protein
MKDPADTTPEQDDAAFERVLEAFAGDMPPAAAAPMPTLGQIAAEICTLLGGVGAFVLVITADGRVDSAAVAAPGLATEAMKLVNASADHALRTGQGPTTAPICVACQGAKLIQGLPCLGCSGKGVRS